MVSSSVLPGFTVFIMLVVIGILICFGFSLFMYFRLRQKKEGDRVPHKSLILPLIFIVTKLKIQVFNTFIH